MKIENNLAILPSHDNNLIKIYFKNAPYKSNNFLDT